MSTISLYKEMNFGLGETADMIRDHVNSFSSQEIAPLAEQTDIDNTKSTLAANGRNGRVRHDRS